jgi:hypothetical protein
MKCPQGRKALIDDVAEKRGKAAPILGSEWNDLGQEALRRSVLFVRGLHVRGIA